MKKTQKRYEPAFKPIEQGLSIAQVVKDIGIDRAEQGKAGIGKPITAEQPARLARGRELAESKIQSTAVESGLAS